MRCAELARGSALDPALLAAVDEAQGSEAPQNEDEPEEGAEADDDTVQDAATEPALEAAKKAIKAFYESDRTSDLELPSSLSRNQRKQLHVSSPLIWPPHPLK